MTEGPALARAYRWCFKAYPRSYLAEHGDDVMALVAEVHAGERHVSVRECGSIVRSGLERRLRQGRLRYWLPAVLILEAAAAVFLAVAGVLAVLDQPAKWQHSYLASLSVGFTIVLDTDVPRVAIFLAALIVLAALLAWRGVTLARSLRVGAAGPLRGVELAVVLAQPILLLAVGVVAEGWNDVVVVYPSFAVAARLLVPAAAGVLFVVVAALWRPFRLSVTGVLGTVAVLLLTVAPAVAAGYSPGVYPSSWWVPALSGTSNVALGFTNPISVHDGSSTPTAVDCPTTSRCFAYGWGELPFVFGDHSYDTFAETAGGDSWHAVPVPPRLFDEVSGIAPQLSCPTPRQCFVLGQPALGGAWEVAVTNDAGSSWFRTEPPVAAKDAGSRLACPSANTCLFATSVGIAVTDDAGASWRVAVRFAGTPTSTTLLGLSCAGPLDCAVLVSTLAGSRDLYAFLATGDGGRSWARRVVTVAGFVGFSLACLTAQRCLVGGLSSQGMWLTSNAGRSWARIPGPTLAVLTCPTASTCWAIGTGSSMLRSDTTGESWLPITPPGVGVEVRAIGCPTAKNCTVVGIRRLSHLVPFIATTDNGGLSWVEVPFPTLPLRDLPAPRSLL